MLTCDLHVHTNFSKDGESSVEEILRQAEAVGLDVIAITDHDCVDGAKKALTCDSPGPRDPRDRSLDPAGPPAGAGCDRGYSRRP